MIIKYKGTLSLSHPSLQSQDLLSRQLLYLFKVLFCASYHHAKELTHRDRQERKERGKMNQFNPALFSSTGKRPFPGMLFGLISIRTMLANTNTHNLCGKEVSNSTYALSHKLDVSGS